MTLHDRVRAACKADAQAADPAAAPGSAGSPEAPAASASRCRTLIFDSGHDGFGDTVFGLASTFVAALLDDRAFLIRQEWLPFAFEPATFDWRDTTDIIFSEPSWRISDENNPPDVPYARLSLYNRNVTNPEALFGKLSGIAHIGLLWNRGILFNLLTKEKGAWADKFRGIGLTPPYAFACVMRFLLRPKPEVWQLMRGISQQVNAPNSISIGIHVRVQDGIVWEDYWHDGVPKVLNETVVEELYNENKQAFECAQELEQWWRPVSLRVTWFLICNSAHLKAALRDRFPNKIVTTEFIPRHVAISKEPNSTARTGPPAWYQETVAEWLLLASTHLLIIPADSVFSRSAVMYSMRPGGVCMAHKCRPDAPVPVGDLAVAGCGV
ncbi:unnamed protein product [Closterium sp. Naga37s-1]|nr:unnamed protein product [Closterium sp. Naga37s-1]